MVCNPFTKATEVSHCTAGLDGQRYAGRDKRSRKANEVSISAFTPKCQIPLNQSIHFVHFVLFFFNLTRRIFTKMPSEHYMIEAQLILKCAAEDVAHAEEIRTAIKDIIDIRAAKLRTSMDDFMKGDGTYAKLDNLTVFEIHSVRPLLPYSLDLIDRLSRKMDEQNRGGGGGGAGNQSSSHFNSTANISYNSHA